MCTAPPPRSARWIRGTLNARFRNGLPSNVADLLTVAVSHAHAIVVPAPHACDAAHADNIVLNITMALNALQLHPTVDVVAELRDIDDEDMVELLGGSKIVTIVSHDIVGR